MNIEISKLILRSFKKFGGEIMVNRIDLKIFVVVVQDSIYQGNKCHMRCLKGKHRIYLNC